MAAPLAGPVEVGGEYTRRPPFVVVAGSASRDLDAGDPRGWRLGGGVTYGALALARLGLPVGAVIGVDALAATAWELDALRTAGAQVHLVPLRRCPVLTNDDRGGTRRQTCHEPGEPFGPAALPAAWRRAPAWLLALIAAELTPAWADVPPPDAIVALGWQGLLRRMAPGRVVRRRAAGPHPLLARADLVGVGRHELAPSLAWRHLARWVGAERADGAALALTAGARGALLVRFEHGRMAAARLAPAMPATRLVDPTGAGDVFLAALLAARLGVTAATRSDARALAVASAAASLTVEGQGVETVPTLRQVAARLAAR